MEMGAGENVTFWFFLGCTFCCAFFPAMPLDILVLENVSWWYWGAGSTAKMQVLKTLQQGSYIFWSLGFPGNSLRWQPNWLSCNLPISFLVVMFYRFYRFFRDVLGCSVVFLDVFLFIYVFFCNPGTNLVITVMFTSSFYPMRAQCFVTSQEVIYIFWKMEASREITTSKM